ncbi:alpha-mannosidase I MNS4-like [Rosa rugosa]|uniref:alpha-mannosidase I MNS4-like n=1 Tax=Rosa rugosa TaxID=74645 RepID=UPI002B416070|nr:alpha-mannosidase I MNS4-like [Rosa rugosa]
MIEKDLILLGVAAVEDKLQKGAAIMKFPQNKTVSVFETAIRVLGGLLSTHLIASDYAMGMRIPTYDNQLLNLAEDLGRRLLPAFDTPLGVLYLLDYPLLFDVHKSLCKIFQAELSLFSILYHSQSRNVSEDCS